jgi:hypothetical protein
MYIYVDNNNPSGASDSNPGTDINAPLVTIKKASQISQPGDTIYIREGVYNESMDTTTQSGSPGAYVKYQNYENEEVIIRPGIRFLDGWNFVETNPSENPSATEGYYYRDFHETDEGLNFSNATNISHTSINLIKRAGIDGDVNSGFCLSRCPDLDSFINPPSEIEGVDTSVYDFYYVELNNNPSEDVGLNYNPSANQIRVYLRLCKGTPLDVYFGDNQNYEGFAGYAHYIELNGLIIEYAFNCYKPTYTSGGDTDPDYSSHHIEFNNCEFRYSRFGIQGGGPLVTEINVDDCYMHTFGRPFKYYLGEWSVNNLDRCYYGEFHNSSIKSSTFKKSYSYCIKFNGDYGTIQDNYIEGILVNSSTADSEGYVNIFNNRIVNGSTVHGSMVFYNYLKNSNFYNNVILTNTDTYSIIVGDDHFGFENVNLYNNIIGTLSDDTYNHGLFSIQEGIHLDHNIYYSSENFILGDTSPVEDPPTHTYSSFSEYQNDSDILVFEIDQNSVMATGELADLENIYTNIEDLTNQLLIYLNRLYPLASDRQQMFNGETLTITENISSIIFKTITHGDQITIVIGDNSYIVRNNNGSMIWDYNGDDETTFTEINERRIGVISSSTLYNVVYKGTGSFLFDIYLTDNEYISKDNFIVVYIYGDEDSEAFADYYINTHNLRTINSNPSGSSESGTTGSGIYWQVDGQKVGIQSTTTAEILSDQDVFYNNIEEPIFDALNSEELISKNIWGMVLGYKFPGGYYYLGTDPSGNLFTPTDPSYNIITEDIPVISSTSRLSRVRHTFSLQTPNKLYNKQISGRFDGDDYNHLMIVSRIDGPTLQFAKDVVDNADVFNKQGIINGKFYIDPYSDKATTGAGAYTESLEEFDNNLLPTLNMESFTTTFMDPYIDITIPYVENDSFVWSWFSDRSNDSFFQTTNASRVFLYNADYDGGFILRDSNSKRWPYLALNAGYVLTAGAMSNPTIGGFLNPNAFFYSLRRGSLLGESFYYSNPYLDWTISLFGDPIPTCVFSNPEDIEIEGVIDEHVVWELMAKDAAIAAANLYKKEKEIREVVDSIVDITSGSSIAILLLALLSPPFTLGEGYEAATALLYPANDLHISVKEIVWKSHLKKLIDRLFEFPTFRYFNGAEQTSSPNINNYLEDNDFKVSRILADITRESKPIDEDNLYDEGWWQFEFTLNDDDYNNYVNYHFILEVASDEDFSDILFTKDSYSITNWTYEKEKEEFTYLLPSGVSSSYIGRKVRYESRVDSLIGIDEYLTRGETYYFRITQYNLLTSERYSPREYSNIIYT